VGDPKVFFGNTYECEVIYGCYNNRVFTIFAENDEDAINHILATTEIDGHEPIGVKYCKAISRHTVIHPKLVAKINKVTIGSKEA
tara:strand:+ start:2582 stop:2836 length:255 start_codon:yes stop_codon:yes gene_type:complete